MRLLVATRRERVDHHRAMAETMVRSRKGKTLQGFSLKRGLDKDSYPSWSIWTKAVARITPATNALIRKKALFSGRNVVIFLARIGSETPRARPSRSMMATSLFQSLGSVVGIATRKQLVVTGTPKPRGFAFVMFSESSSADKALQDTHVILGRTVEVKKAIPRNDHFRTNNSSSTIQINNRKESVENAMQKNFHELNNRLVEVKRAVPKEGSNGRYSNQNMKPGAVRGSPYDGFQAVEFTSNGSGYGMFPGYAPPPAHNPVGDYLYGTGVYGYGYPMATVGLVMVSLQLLLEALYMPLSRWVQWGYGNQSCWEWNVDNVDQPANDIQHRLKQ
ncbi:Growth-regulating factor 1 [Hibiscus syriacus]|uniref:Growth-regulating factor 1 n=1 Tax=Hibiscus syriacus TaxID=106335 RepID=A0A6A3CVT8_HIBSY|nr:Growth-regulating factor 1 [Hibiscus syriacus]